LKKKDLVTLPISKIESPPKTKNESTPKTKNESTPKTKNESTPKTKNESTNGSISKKSHPWENFTLNLEELLKPMNKL